MAQRPSLFLSAFFKSSASRFDEDISSTRNVVSGRGATPRRLVGATVVGAWIRFGV